MLELNLFKNKNENIKILEIRLYINSRVETNNKYEKNICNITNLDILERLILYENFN